MKRIHLFEFEDFHWFPGWLRECMTQYIIAVHKLINSSQDLIKLINKALGSTNSKHIYDLCSGSGGPMPQVYQKLKKENKDILLTLSDLYPHKKAIQEYNSAKIEGVDYCETFQNAADFDPDKKGLRTMICSLHHMTPEIAKDILKEAQKSKQPFLAYEISDNSFPKWIWWIAFPINIITVLIITAMVRPMTWQQIIFTYIIPILPIVIAWDGAVSNARTYTLQDMDILLDGMEKKDYKWETGTIKGKMGNKLYLMGMPQS